MKGYTLLSFCQHAVMSHEKFPSITMTYIKTPTEIKRGLTHSFIKPYERSTANIILNGEICEPFHYSQEQDKHVHSYH